MPFLWEKKGMDIYIFFSNIKKKYIFFNYIFGKKKKLKIKYKIILFSIFNLLF